MIRDAKNVAKRSILIDHCGSEHIDLKSEFKNIENVYTITRELKRGYSKLSLIEFNSIADADFVSTKASHGDGLLPVPLKFFHYRGKSDVKFGESELDFPVEHVKLSYRREFSKDLTRYTDLIRNNSMTTVGLKLRFITLVNLEQIFCSGLFEEYELLPYGSSVIDIGSDSGDLDLLFTRKIDHEKAIKENQIDVRKMRGKSHSYNDRTIPHKNTIVTTYNLKDKTQSTLESSLSHLDKKLYHEPRCHDGLKGIMKLFDYILREYLPLTDPQTVLSVPNAKVPIIKFTSRVTLIDCDLSFNLGFDDSIESSDSSRKPAYSVVIMSHILFSLCRNNNLFTSVVVYLRTYGRVSSITSKGSTIKFTNFQLLSLIIFYLQQIGLKTTNRRINFPRNRNQGMSSQNSSYHDTSNSQDDNNIDIELVNRSSLKPILPPFKLLLDPDFDHSNWTIQLSEQQIEALVPKIVEGFFKYYSHFDFHSRAISLYDSRHYIKLDNSTIYVDNPLDETRNVCHNVTNRGRDHFVKNISKALETIHKPKGQCRSLLELTKDSFPSGSSNRILLDESLDAPAIVQDLCR